MNYLSLFLSAAALAWGFINHRRAVEAELRLQNLRSSHFRLADQLREQVETLQAEVRSLRHQLRAATNEGALFTADMTVGEAIELDPRAAEVMGAFHIGGCSSCAVSPTDTLQYAAEGNGQDVGQLLQALNRLASAGDEVTTELLAKKPNVQISL